jgi:Ca2+-binding RTX toxin-like protein
LNDGTTQAYTVSITGDTASADTINNNSNVQLTLNAYPTDITGATNVTGSAGTTDVLNLTSLASGTATFDTNNDVFETINVVAVGTSIATTLAMPAYDTSGTGGAGVTTVTINASSLSATNTLVLNNATVDSNMAVTSGAGADAITLGTGADTVTSGAGNDTITGTTGGSNVIDTGAGVDTMILSASVSENVSMGAGNDIITGGGNLDALDTIDGGDGTDTLTVTSTLTGGSVIGGVSNIEVIKPIGNFTITATGDMGGASVYNLTENTGAHTLTLGTATAPYSKATTVVLTGQGATSTEVINATYSAGAITVQGLSTDFDNGLAITGSAGSDTLEITAAGASNIDDVIAVETVKIKDSSTAGTDASLTVYDGSVLAYGGPTSVVVDASELDGGVGAFDEIFTLVGGGTDGTAPMPLNVTSGGGADILDGGAGNDTIDGGAGADIIDGNAGLDNLSGGAGNDVMRQNSKAEFITAYGADIIDGGDGTDTLELGVAMNLVATQLGTISNIEKISIPDGSDLTISDAVLAANPGVKFNFAGAGTLSTGEDTAGASLMTTAINVDSTAAGNVKLIGSQAADTFTFHTTETLTADDTIDGNAGSDTIILSTQDDLDTTGEAVSGTFGANVTNVETIKISDQGADQAAGNAEVIINSGFTGLAITVDGTELDANPTDLTAGESLTVTNGDNTALTVLGGGFNDTVTSSGGNDSIVGNAGADSLKAGDGADTIEGGAGADALWGEGGLDSIDGGAGNDVIHVADDAHFKTSGGVETVNGGAGTDTLNFAEADALTLTAPELSKLYSIEKITLTGSTTASLTFGNETFTNLGNSSLQITTTTGNSTTAIDGSAVTNGSFLVIDDNTNANNDSITGGSGDDIFRVGDTFLAVTDSFNGNAGTDTIQLDNDDAVTASLDFDLIRNVEQLTIYTVDGVSAGLATVTLGAAAADSTNTGTSYGSFTFDFTGNTVGGVLLNNDNTNDIKYNFTIIGGTAADDLAGSLGNDTISGGGTTTGDVLEGNGGNDSITGNSGADAIDGGAGNDILAGGAGNDTIKGAGGNDIINGGDGVDTIDGEGGADTITSGAGKDIHFYNAVTDSSGNTKDTITDFTQSTLNATTGAVITAGDSIKIVIPQAAFAANDADSFIASDKGDVNNAGEAASAMNDTKGSFVFSKDNDVLYLDYDGDSTLNADDYAFVLTDLDTFHGADIDFDITAQNQILTVTTLDGDDKITGGTAADIINTGGGNDTVIGNNGIDIINTGAGNDSITGGSAVDTIDAGSGDDIISSGAGIDIVTGGTGDDVFNAGTAAAPAILNRLVIKDFEDAGTTVGDVLTIDSSYTTLANETAGASSTMITINATQNSGAVSLLTGDADATTTADIIELNETELTAANLATDFANGVSTNLFLLLGDGDGTATSLTTAAATDSFYILAYDGGEAFLYFANADGAINDAALTAAEVLPIAHFDSAITLGAFDGSDFIMG